MQYFPDMLIYETNACQVEIRDSWYAANKLTDIISLSLFALFLIIEVLNPEAAALILGKFSVFYAPGHFYNNNKRQRLALLS